MRLSPIVLAAAAVTGLTAAGCGALFQSKETRQRIEEIKDAVRQDPGAVDALDQDGQASLHRAIIDSYVSLQDWLLDHGANPNGRNARGESALHVAVLSDQSEGRRTIRTLISRGADPDAVRDDGTSPLHVAAGFGTEASLRALLEAGADPRVRSHRGDTPLHLAAAPQPARKPDECRLFVRELVARGADPNAHNGFEIAPLHQAALVGHLPVVRGLLDAGAKVDLEGPEGGTALSMAAVSGHAPIVALLLARGADPGHQDRAGFTALDAVLAHPAMRYGNGAAGPVNVEAVVELLRPHDGTARLSR